MPWRGRLVVVASVALAVTAARADVLCKRRNGAVVVRTACKKKETALDLAQFGVVGPTGATGPQGASGPAGPPGGFIDALPSSKTLTGFTVLASATAGQRVSNLISFPIPVSTDILVEVVHDGDAPHLNCPGRFRGPSATPGYLCIYEGSRPSALAASSAYPTYGGGHIDATGISVYADHDFTTTDAILYLTWAVMQP